MENKGISSGMITCDEIGNLLCNRLGLEVPSADTDLFEAGILDSMGFVEVLLHLENNFGIRLSPDEIEFDNFRSVEKIAQFVASRVLSETIAER